MGCSGGKVMEENNGFINKDQQIAVPQGFIQSGVTQSKEKRKEEKELILKFLFETLDKYRESENLHDFQFAYKTSHKIKKDKYSNLEKFSEKKFKLIKGSNREFKWERESAFKSEIEDFFIKYPHLNHYNDFDFSQKILEYEKTDLEFKFNRLDNFTENTFDIKNKEAYLFIFFSFEEYEPIQKLKEIQKYFVENPSLRQKVKIVPIVNEIATGADDAKRKEEILNLIGFKNLGFDCYVLTDNNDYLKEYLDFETKKSFCVIYDKNKTIRTIGECKDIYPDDIKVFLEELEYKEKNYKDDKKIMDEYSNFGNLKASSNESSVVYGLTLERTKIYSQFGEVKGIYFTPPKLFVSYNTKTSPNKEELIKTLSGKLSGISISCEKPITKKEIRETISHEVHRMKEKNKWKEKQLYTILFNVSYFLHRNYFFGRTKNQEVAMNYFLNDENSLDIDCLEADFKYLYSSFPQLKFNKDNKINFQGEIGKPLPTMISLHDVNDNQDIMDLTDSSKPKAIFFVSQEIDEKEKFETYKNIFWEQIQKYIGEDGRYLYYIVYRGTNGSMENAEELEGDMFKGQKKFHWKYENHESDLRINVDRGFDYLLMLLNKNNELIYLGDITDIDLTASLFKLLHDKPLVFNKINRFEKAKFIELKHKLTIFANGLRKHFDNECFFYKPLIEFKYNHSISMEDSKELNNQYYNFEMKIVLKSSSSYILQKQDLKYFINVIQNELKGKVEVENLDTCEIQDSIKCSTCVNIVSPSIGHFLDPETNEIFCENCERLKNDSENKIYHPNNLIFMRYDHPKILKEIVKKYFEDNKPSQNFLEGLDESVKDYPECAICRAEIKKNKLVWYSLVHLYNEKFPLMPVLICDPNCFPILTKKESHLYVKFNESQTENLKMNFISEKNLILKKVIFEDSLF